MDASATHVNRLQTRIAKATVKGNKNKVKRLQYLLTQSFYAKAYAVKKVTSNKGKNTSGVDKKLWSTAASKMKAALEFKWNGKQNDKDYKRYTCKNYMDCGEKASCTSSQGGRSVTRIKEEEEILEMINKNTIDKNDIYRKRGTIVEHPFGTIKRYFGYTYFLTRGLDSVNTEGCFICLAYNFKRLINIMGVNELVRRFKEAIRLKLSIYFCNHQSVIKSTKSTFIYNLGVIQN